MSKQLDASFKRYDIADELYLSCQDFSCIDLYEPSIGVLPVKPERVPSAHRLMLPLRRALSFHSEIVDVRRPLRPIVETCHSRI